jgi:hypothetical protein
MAIRIQREDDDEPAGSHRGSDGWDLSRERPTDRADIDRDQMIITCSLPFGVRWMFRFDRTFHRREDVTGSSFWLLLPLALMTVGATFLGFLLLRA